MKRVPENMFMRVCAAVVMCCVMFSCNKYGLQGDGITGEAEVVLSFTVKDESVTKAAENTIKDVKVWAFEMGENGMPVDADGVAAAYIAAEFTNTNTTETLTMYIPVSDEEKKYRFFAVANEKSFGHIYRHREFGGAQQKLVLGQDITYDQLSRAVFDATHVASGTSNASMPFTHWTDASLKNGNSNPYAITVPVYRPVAKTEFHAKVVNGSNYTFKVNSIKLFSSKIAIPVQGAMFSDYTPDNLSSSTSPSIFGDYSDLEVSAQPVPATLYNSYPTGANPVFTAKEVTETSELIGAASIYENNHGDAYSEGFAGETSHYDFTSPANYPTGTIYMEIEYSYEEKISGDDSGTGRCYLPLPRIVRNNNYKINATFDMKKEGALILAYSVEPWTVQEDTMEFKYPTIEVSAVKKNSDNTPNYDQPKTQYNAAFFKDGIPIEKAPTVEQGAFAFYFKMADSDIETRNWTVHFTEYTMIDGRWIADEDQGDDFVLAVCDDNAADSKNTVIKDEYGTQNKLTFHPAGNQYQIRLYPKKTYDANCKKAAEIYITYPAEWLGGAADELLINAGGGGTLWTNSGNERYKIGVIQDTDFVSNGN